MNKIINVAYSKSPSAPCDNSGIIYVAKYESASSFFDLIESTLAGKAFALFDSRLLKVIYVPITAKKLSMAKREINPKCSRNIRNASIFTLPK
jgi:hypothetical protein